jgi:hypothetical protein
VILVFGMQTRTKCESIATIADFLDICINQHGFDQPWSIDSCQSEFCKYVLYVTVFLEIYSCLLVSYIFVGLIIPTAILGEAFSVFTTSEKKLLNEFSTGSR